MENYSQDLVNYTFIELDKKRFFGLIPSLLCLRLEHELEHEEIYNSPLVNALK